MDNDKRKELRELANKSTQVVSWYPTMDSSYEFSIRGPYHRWFKCKEVDEQYRNLVADAFDDVEFTAAAMNNLVPLLDELDKKDQIINELKEMLKGIL